MPEFVDSTVIGDPGKIRKTEREITAARRAFATAQSLLAGSPLDKGLTLNVGWHSSTVNRENGSFAVIAYAAGLDDLIGEVVKVTFRRRYVFAYVLEPADLPAGVQVSVTRRLFLALNRLTLEHLSCNVAAVV